MGIVGGGFTGLCCAYYLSRKNYHVVLFEKEAGPGGLARPVPFLDTEIDRYYHFICRFDSCLLAFVNELELGGAVKWRRTDMDYHVKGRLYPFTDPQDLLGFKPLSLWNRFRFGVSMLPFFLLSDWRSLDTIPNDAWLIRWGGQKVYDIIWKPLMVKKYHHRHREIPAAWVWGRTRRRSRSRHGFPRREVLGYIEGGTKTIIDRITRLVRSHDGELLDNQPVVDIRKLEDGFEIRTTNEVRRVDRLISTIPAPLTADLAPSLPEDYRRRLSELEYLAVICPIIAVDGQIARNYWTNIYETEIPYLGVIEFSRLNPDPGFQGKSVAYMPFYIWPEDDLWSASDETVLSIAIKHLEQMFPWFRSGQIRESLVHRDRYSQPLIQTGHLHRMLPFETPWEGMYILDSSMIYPEDRGLNNCIRLAGKLVSSHF
ncbi:FAD-dependent oxidoreductase [bacterium]|nr:FAD-dependent oxidoreductase [candidate division CSSED10-310 bacterium]